jgi:DNA-binding NtrC family response regulator
LTGYPDLENAVKALNRGAHVYLIKPIKPEKLVKVIKQQLKKREEEVKYSQKKVGEFIKAKVAEIKKGGE